MKLKLKKFNQPSENLLNQKEEYLNKNIVGAFHVLSIQGSYKLIGSRTIRNLLYSNDYDLNESFTVKNDKHIWLGLKKHFLSIFEKCMRNRDYYILDFKCGENKKGEPLRWTMQDLRKGFILDNGDKYEFVDCLKMDAIIKIDMCYVLHGEFIEITNNYFIHVLTDKKEHTEKHNKVKDEILNKLDDDIEELTAKGEYFKALKRLFSIERISGKIDDDLLDFLNSDYGLFYKTIHDLKLVVEMLEQNFKPVENQLIVDNLERIKQNTSHITLFNVDEILNKINHIKASKIKTQLNEIIEHSNKILNKLVKEHIDNFI